MAKEHYYIPKQPIFKWLRKPIVWCKTVTRVKKLIKKYGDSGLTYHYERDGTCFEVSGIEVKESNTVRYNRHL
jgi:hypothetical protein